MGKRQAWIVVAFVAALAPAARTTAAAPPVEPARVTMAFSGDVLVHRPIIDRALANGGGRTYDFAPMFDALRPLVSSVDLAVCHLETPIAPPGEPLSYHPIYGVPPEIVDGIASAGYDRCSTASNHSADRGVTGIDATVTALEQAGLGSSGMARTPAEAEPQVFTVNGVRISHLAYAYGLNGLVLPAGQEWRVRLLDPDRIIADAREAHRRGAEYVVVSLHWGNETDWRITAAQRSLAEVLTASGEIDLIVGHHVHVLQPIEQINGVWVVYGLSNLLSNLPGGSERFPPSSQDGAVVTLSVERRADGSFATGRPSVHPTWVDHERYLIRDVAADLADPATPAGLRAVLNESLARTRAVLGPYVADGYVPARCAAEPVAEPAPTGFVVDASPSVLTPVAPARLLDTRQAGDDGYVCPGRSITVPVAGHGGVPATGATAAVLNVTAIAAGRPGFVTVWPAGSARPTASNLNLTRAGQVRANQVVVPLGADGAVQVYAQSGAHVAVDVAGWFGPSGPASAGRVVALDPARLLDTRVDPGGPLAGGVARDVQVTGRGGVPAASAAAALVNVTATDASAAGFVTAWPTGSARPGTSTVNMSGPGEVAPNLALVPLAPDGRLSLFANVTTDVVVDVVGYVTDASAPADDAGRFVPLAPARVIDTRTPGASVARLGSGAAATVTHAGVAGIPSTGASAVALNVTAVDAAAGYLTVFPAGSPRPLASTLNTAAGDTRPNASVMRLGAGGAISFASQSGGDLVVDVTGWFTA